MKNINKYLLLWALAATGVAGLMTYNTVKMVDAAAAETYYNETPQICPTLPEQLEERAHEIREERKEMDLEKYRQEAMREVNGELQTLLDDSPFVDYEELAEQYGN